MIPRTGECVLQSDQTSLHYHPFQAESKMCRSRHSRGTGVSEEAGYTPISCEDPHANEPAALSPQYILQ